MEEYKIYSLNDPITDEVRYIGKTVSLLSKRLSSHYKDKKISYKTHWINSLKEKGLKPIIKLVEFCDETNWQEREKYWIGYYREITRLTNYLDGGQGQQKGYKHTPEAIEKIREASKKQSKGKFEKGRKWERKMADGNLKKILQYNLDGEFIQEWEGIITASLSLKINKDSIIGCLKGRISRGGKFQWRYYYENYELKINKYINKSGNFRKNSSNG